MKSQLMPSEKEPSGRRFGPRMPGRHRGEVRGIGSGMIMDTAGHILTNSHVASGATKIEVRLYDGSNYEAKLVGSDPKTDLAVIRIETKERLTPVVFGDSDKLAVGQWVVAIGQPRGLNETVTQGIISAQHRAGLLDPMSYQDFIQTDAALNPGNSGGPLLNLKGEVIGVNTAIASESGGSEGLGFAVPSNIALHIGKTLIAYGKVERAWLGVTIGLLTPEKAKSLGLTGVKGAFIVEITKDSPADRAGIRKGDLITAYQGKEITDPVTLQNAVAMTPVGSDVKITVLREGKKQELTARLASMAEADKIMEASARERLGAEFRPMTPQEAGQVDLRPQQGVVVAKIDPQGPLAKAGMEVGDIIVDVNGRMISGLDSFAEIIATVPPNEHIILVAADLKKKIIAKIRVKVK
jgi:serine protease Do